MDSWEDVRARVEEGLRYMNRKYGANFHADDIADEDVRLSANIIWNAGRYCRAEKENQKV